MRNRTWGFWLSVLVGWSGGIFGIYRGISFVTQPLYAQATSNTSEYTEAVLSLSLGGMLVVGGLVALIYCILVALLTVGKRGLFAAYSAGFFGLRLLSVPSIGWVFLPAMGLMVMAAGLCFTTRQRSSSCLAQSLHPPYAV